MSSAARRARMEALKNGNLSSDEDQDEDIYDEEQQDNFDDDYDDDAMDEFVIDDQDVGYKASAHQKQSKNMYKNRDNKGNKNNNNNDLNRNRNRSKPGSYNISRRKNRNQNKNNSSQSNQTQNKSQPTMNNFFKKSNSTTNKSRISNRNKKLQKKKNKSSSSKPNKNDDNFMDNILANMDSDDDDNNHNTDSNHDNINNDSNNNDMESDTDLLDTLMQDNDETNVTKQSQSPQQRQIDKEEEENVISEPPKKKFKFTATSNTNNNDKKMEIENENDSKEQTPEITSMFMSNNNDNDNKTEIAKEISPENTDNYPQCKTGFIDFFWFDAYEDAVRKPGQIYLFGKTLNKQNEWQSICVFIKNIQRTMYVLPRLKNKTDDIENGERIEFLNVYKELNEKRQRLGISKFAAGPVDKKYCFRERINGIPETCKYLKLMYSFNDPPFQGFQFEKGQTYSKIFGARSTALELFLLDKQIMGPCWLRLPFKKASKIVSWCKQEIELNDPDKITVLSSNYPSPNFKVLSLSFQTVLNDKKEHEIAAISAVIDNSVCIDHSNRNKNQNNNNNNGKNIDYFTLIRKIGRNPIPYDLEKELKIKNYKLNGSSFKSFGTERELLNFFATRLQQIDPDVIVGHKLYDFLLDVILHRMDKLKVTQWSKIGRLRKGIIPFIRGKLNRKYLSSGRLFCDTFLSSQEFIHQKTYTLSHLVDQLLNVKNHENLNINTIKNKWNDGKELCSVITHCCNDSNLVLQLMFKLEILPLTKELTNLCGNLWARSLLSQRAERNEWLLLHEFHRNGYIVPERLTKAEKIQKGIIAEKSANSRKRGKAQYSGGLVLEPQKGLYDKYVLCLDFNSLYPSIIQEYNLCFTTTKHWKYNKNKNDENKQKEKEENEMSSITKMQESISCETGILPKVIGVLLTRRKTVKGLLKSAKDESNKKRYDIQQKALKLVANSMYGCLGFEHSRFYCSPIAALITALGRESLMKASEMASTIANLKVIYGDTDSIFIYTDTDNLIQARNYGKEVKKKVNKTYKKMYLEIDYLFSKMLLLRKKKYAAIKVIGYDTDSSGNAVNIRTTKEIKGLDLVRRDWSIISKDVGIKVLDIILSKDKQIDDVVIGIQELLQSYRKLFDENKIELNRFVITKKLTKQPKDYPDPTKQPHVMVAMEMQKLGMNVQTGSFIEYIICTQNRDGSSVKTGGASKKSIAQRAYHIKEIQNNDKLQVDREWYLEQQILPPVGRYCDPIQGTDIGHLAHSLGLDSNKFAHLTGNKNGSNNNGIIDDDDQDIDDKIMRITNPLQKYNDTCQPLKIKCKLCGVTYDFGGVFNFKLPNAKCGLICASPGCKGIVSSDKIMQKRDIASIKNTLSLQIWNFIYKYYGRKWICIDPTCNYESRQLPLNGNKCPKIGCSSNLKESYKASSLFDQLRYFSFLFDRIEQEKLLKQEQIQNKSLIDTKLTPHQKMVFDDIYKWIKETILERSRYYFIDSKVIFKYL